MEQEIAGIQAAFGQSLSQLLQPYLAGYPEHVQAFLVTSLQAYVSSSSYHITALVYRTVHAQDFDTEQYNSLLLLSYVLQFHVRLNMEQQQHSQGCLRKAIGDDHIYVVQQFLTQMTSQLAVAHRDLLPSIKKYNLLATQCLYESVQFKEQKSYDYHAMNSFQLYHETVFHALVGLGTEDQSLERVFELVAGIRHIRHGMNVIDVVEGLKQICTEAPEFDGYQKVLISKFSSDEIERQSAIYNVQGRSEHTASDMAKKLEDLLLGVDSKWEWVRGLLQ